MAYVVNPFKIDATGDSLGTMLKAFTNADQIHKNRAMADYYGANAAKTVAETEALQNRQAALQSLGDVMKSTLTPQVAGGGTAAEFVGPAPEAGLVPEASGDAVRRMATTLAPVMAQIDPNGGANGVLTAMKIAAAHGTGANGTPTDDLRRALLLAGHDPGVNFSGNAAEANAVANRNSALSTREAIAKLQATPINIGEGNTVIAGIGDPRGANGPIYGRDTKSTAEARRINAGMPADPNGGPLAGNGMDQQAVNYFSSVVGKTQRGEALSEQDKVLFPIMYERMYGPKQETRDTPDGTRVITVQPAAIPDNVLALRQTLLGGAGGTPAAAPVTAASATAGAPAATASQTGVSSTLVPGTEKARGPKTEMQGKMYVGAQRISGATQGLFDAYGFDPSTGKLDPNGYRVGTGTMAARDYLPNNVNRYLMSEQGQNFVTDAENALTPLLRVDSGAAINKDEYGRYSTMFIPLPGEKDSVITKKFRNLQAAERAFTKLSGEVGDLSAKSDDQIKALKPRYDAIKNEELNRLNGGQSGQGIDPSAAISEARAAIAKGLPREEAVRRLQGAGVQIPSDLAATTRTASGAEDAIAQARAAIAKGAPRGAVLQRLRQLGVTTDNPLADDPLGIR